MSFFFVTTMETQCKWVWLEVDETGWNRSGSFTLTA